MAGIAKLQTANLKTVVVVVVVVVVVAAGVVVVVAGVVGVVNFTGLGRV